MSDKTILVFGLPIDWKKFVIIVCMAITGNIKAQIRRPATAMSLSAVSFENNCIIGRVPISHSKNTENMKAKAIVNPFCLTGSEIVPYDGLHTDSQTDNYH